MDRYERIVRLHRLLKLNRTGVTMDRLMEEIGTSRATVYRDIAFLRDALGAPIESNLETHRFKYEVGPEHAFELPGLWLSPDEVYALLVARQALAAQSQGALAEALGDLGPRLRAVVGERVESFAHPRCVRPVARPAPFVWLPAPCWIGAA
jgi:predicted DNA-binding transcriptional regulator YafY